MSQSFSYACSDYPGMESCPGRFVAGTREELWKLMEVHATVAHGEDPGQWTDAERKTVEALIVSA